MVKTLSECMRVLRDDGVMFVNLGDTYLGKKVDYASRIYDISAEALSGIDCRDSSLPKGSLCGVPYRVALGLLDRGYIMRNVIIWHKPSAVPVSVTNRFTNDFEYIFMFVKGMDYRFALQYEDLAESTIVRARHALNELDSQVVTGMNYDSIKNYMRKARDGKVKGRRMRCVWRINSDGVKDSHYATFPEKLVERCLLS